MRSLRSIKTLLYAITVACICASAAIGWWAFTPPHEAPVQQTKQSNRAASPKSTATSTTPPLEKFSPAWRLQLQRPLYDPPPVVVKVEAPPPPKPPQIKLSGTFVEPGNSRALIKDRSGATRVYRIGEVVNAAEISAISDEGIMVIHDNANWQLRVGKEPVLQ